jgi:hypothetical protein
MDLPVQAGTPVLRRIFADIKKGRVGGEER